MLQKSFGGDQQERRAEREERAGKEERGDLELGLGNRKREK